MKMATNAVTVGKSFATNAATVGKGFRMWKLYTMGGAAHPLPHSGHGTASSPFEGPNGRLDSGVLAPRRWSQKNGIEVWTPFFLGCRLRIIASMEKRLVSVAASLLCAALLILAQAPEGPPPGGGKGGAKGGGKGGGNGKAAPFSAGGAAVVSASNLKLLTAQNVEITMQSITFALGVGCVYCHDLNDLSLDTKPPKAKALMMLEMVRDVNTKLGEGTTHVTCWTCHRASTTPQIAKPSTK